MVLLKNKDDFRWIFKIGLLIAICWLPFFLAFYPGLGMNDEISAMQKPFELTNQPIMYNLFLSLFYNAGLHLFDDFFIGTAAATIFQMLLMALSIAYVLRWLLNKGLDRKVVLIYGLYYTFFPIIIDYALALVKDKAFSVAIMLLVPITYELAKDKFSNCSWQRLNGFMLICLVMMWTRNNGAYLFMGFCACVIFIMHGNRKQFLKIAIPVLVLGMLPSLMMGKNFTEGLGIPLQQMSRVVALDRPIGEQDKEFLNRMMPLEMIKKYYNPHNVDRIKWNYAYDRKFTDSHKKDFFITWWNLFKQYPKDYFKAWLLTTQGFWWQVDWQEYGAWQSKFGKAYALDIYLAEDKQTLDNGFGVTSFPTMPEWLKVKLGIYVWKYSFFPMGGICMWFTLLIAMLMCIRKQSHLLIVLAPALLCSLTLILASPIAHALRYVFYYVLCLPLFFILSRIDMLDNNK